MSEEEFQVEGTASVNALKQEQAWCVQETYQDWRPVRRPVTTVQAGNNRGFD